MTTGVYRHSNLGMAVIGSGAIVSLSAVSDRLRSGAAPTVVYRSATAENGKVQGKVASWGTNNLYPQDRVALIEKDTELPQFLDFKARMLAGERLAVFKLEGYDAEGNEILGSATGPLAMEAIAFVTARNTKKYLSEAAIDFHYFFNVFPELIVSRDRSRITGIFKQEATDCRWEEMDEQGRIKNCWINGNWAQYNDKHTMVLPVIDEWADDATEYVRTHKSFKFIYPAYYSSPGKKYYQTPLHEGFFTSGWYDVSQAIPEFKKYMMQNQMSIKYHIEIDTAWWPLRFPKWEDMTEKERSDAQDTVLATFNELMSGAKNAKKVLMTFMKHQPGEAQQVSMWRITPINDKKQDGEYIEDSREASMHKLRAMGLDPAIVGAGPGRDNASAGSGSDKWAAIKIYLAGLGAHRNVLLEPIDFIFEYNGWKQAGLVARFVDNKYFNTPTASSKPERNDLPNPVK